MLFVCVRRSLFVVFMKLNDKQGFALFAVLCALIEKSFTPHIIFFIRQLCVDVRQVIYVLSLVLVLLLKVGAYLSILSLFLFSDWRFTLFESFTYVQEHRHTFECSYLISSEYTHNSNASLSCSHFVFCAVSENSREIC